MDARNVKKIASAFKNFPSSLSIDFMGDNLFLFLYDNWAIKFPQALKQIRQL